MTGDAGPQDALPLFPATPLAAEALENEFYAAAAEGRFLLRSCGACGAAHWYPRAICPFCHDPATGWIVASGRGTVLSWTVLRWAAPVPYALAFVALEEGPAMMSNLVACDLDALAVGMRVELVFGPANGVVVPRFRPAGASVCR